jgi:hypothetical protein
MENIKTLGEKRVNVDFNVTNDDTVHQIKVKTAELLDLCETMRDGKGPEAQRAISIAQTGFEDAAMWAVKSNFIK